MKKVLFVLCAMALLAPAALAQEMTLLHPKAHTKAFAEAVANLQQELKDNRITVMNFVTAVKVEYRLLLREDPKEAHRVGAKLAVDTKFETSDGRLFTILEFIDQNRDVIAQQDEDTLDFAEQLVEDFNAANKPTSAAKNLLKETNGRFNP